MKEDSAIKLLSDLVSIDSVNPSLSPNHPGEREIADFLGSWLEERGIPFEEQPVIGDRCNIVARLGEGERKLLIVSHMDTVGVDSMTIPPFEPRIDGDLLYGRGSADTKGGMTAALLALEDILRNGPDLDGELVFAATVDEEHEAKGVEKLAGEVRADAALVMEPVDMKAVIAHKGFAWMEFDIFGRAAHGSDVGLGIDAIMRCGVLIERLRAIDRGLSGRYHELLGPPSLHASEISGGEGWSTYPAFCRLTVERRTLPEETEEDISEEISETTSSLEKEGIEIDGRLIFFRKGTEISTQEMVVRSLMAAASAQGITVPLGGMPAWFEAGILNQAGMPSVVFGPSGCKGHESEEFVSINSVVACSKIIREMIPNFLESTGP